MKFRKSFDGLALRRERVQEVVVGEMDLRQMLIVVRDEFIEITPDVFWGGCSSFL